MSPANLIAVCDVQSKITKYKIEKKEEDETCHINDVSITKAIQSDHSETKTVSSVCLLLYRHLFVSVLKERFSVTHYEVKCLKETRNTLVDSIECISRDYLVTWTLSVLCV